MTQEKHCEWGPSSLARIAACPGSVHACHNLPEFKTDEATDTGTRVHAAVAAVINSDPDYRKGVLAQEQAERLVEGQLLTDASERRMAEDCLMYLSQLLKTSYGAGDYEVHAEFRLDAFSFAGALYWGTADVVISGDHLAVIDWKTGMGEVPEAKDNLQGAAYAAAAMLKFKADVCDVHFFNPRQHSHSHYVFMDCNALLRKIADILDAAMDPDAPLHDGAQCRYCRAQQWGVCPLLEGRRASAMARGALEQTTLEQMAPEEIERLRNELEILVLQKDSLDKFLKAKAAASPEGWNGWKMERSFAGAEITDPAAAFGAVKDVLDGDYFLSLGKFTQRKVADAYAEVAKQCGLVKTKKEGAELAKEKLKECSKEIYRETLVKEEAK
jgi:hypothetical protein